MRLDLDEDCALSSNTNVQLYNVPDCPFDRVSSV